MSSVQRLALGNDRVWGWAFQICRSGHFASGGRSEDLRLKDSNDGKHGDAGVLDLGLMDPVEINSDAINGGKTKGDATSCWHTMPTLSLWGWEEEEE